jgi:hypothetical protein
MLIVILRSAGNSRVAGLLSRTRHFLYHCLENCLSILLYLLGIQSHMPPELSFYSIEDTGSPFARSSNRSAGLAERTPRRCDMLDIDSDDCELKKWSPLNSPTNEGKMLMTCVLTPHSTLVSTVRSGLDNKNICDRYGGSRSLIDI